MLDNFSWVLPGKLAASAKPGSTNAEEADLNFLYNEGVQAIVTLCRQPLNSGLVARFGFLTKHVPVEDFCAPSFEQIERAALFIERRILHSQPVLVHCRAGYGRTGTIIACYLVKRGMLPSQAIAEIRRARPGSVEAKGQERAVHLYYRKIHAAVEE